MSELLDNIRAQVEYGPYQRFMWRHRSTPCARGSRNRYRRGIGFVPLFAYQVRRDRDGESP